MWRSSADHAAGGHSDPRQGPAIPRQAVSEGRCPFRSPPRAGERGAETSHRSRRPRCKDKKGAVGLVCRGAVGQSKTIRAGIQIAPKKTKRSTTNTTAPAIAPVIRRPLSGPSSGIDGVSFAGSVSSGAIFTSMCSQCSAPRAVRVRRRPDRQILAAVAGKLNTLGRTPLSR